MMFEIPLRRVLPGVLSAFLMMSALAVRGEDRALPGTAPLTIDRPLDEVMLDGLHAFAERALAGAEAVRDRARQRDYSSADAYARSVTLHRERLRAIIGAVDPRSSGSGLEWIVALDLKNSPSESGGTDSWRVRSPVRWQVIDGVTAEGILIEPQGKAKANVVALPDADWTPEMFAGMSAGVAPQARLPLALVANGCRVLIPTLINRDDTWSSNPDARMTNQPHREFVYRCAYPVGRHIIGYEVQKVLAAVDAFQRDESTADMPVGVAGVGEGGLLALFAAALDPRIDAALVCGYFEPRDKVFREPVYRNVWRQLTEFGDAELAGLIAPRTLVVEACAAPEVDGPPPPRERRTGGGPGRIRTPSLERVRREFDRARVHFERLGAPERITLATSGDGTGPAGSPEALSAFARGLNLDLPLRPAADPPGKELIVGAIADPSERQRRQLAELIDHTQKLMRASGRVRERLWSRADRSSVAAWEKSVAPLRRLVYDEMIGRLPDPGIPVNPRTRRIFDEPKFTGYEVVLDVYPDVIATGILLLPRDLQPGDRRPVVICQHGINRTPMVTIVDDSRREWQTYRGFARQLVERGFVVYSPQDPYQSEERFRSLVRKSTPLGRTLYSYIIRQHERTLEWLSSLPGVDPGRIALYGLSFGGRTALYVPSQLDRYAVSISSAFFNDWPVKVASIEAATCFPLTREYEVPDWNVLHIASHAELAWLISPRPFMVERGHDDGVAPDEWVAKEYARVRRHYVKLGIPDRTAIEYFDGGHRINAAGTFDFLHRHLDWPEPE